MRILSLLIVGTLLGCGVAPVHKGDDVPGPPVWRYVGHHGRPLAFGGFVCAIEAPHDHEFPPSPRSAFVETPQGFRDTRRTWAFFNPHPHHGRTCFREGWHLHLEPPDATLILDEEKAAYRAMTGP